jgi:hypothetical protein
MIVESVALTWRDCDLWAGGLRIGEVWYVGPRKVWRIGLGVGFHHYDDFKTESEARAGLETAAVKALGK